MSETQRAEACTWTEQTDDWQTLWHTTCDKDWSFEEGGPTENSVRFCHFCGGVVTARPERRGQYYFDRREDDEPISHPDRRSGADRRQA